MMLRTLLIALLLQIALASPAIAEEPVPDETVVDEAEASGEDEAVEDDDGQIKMPNAGSIYIPLKPSFVVNYGGPGRLKYIKAEVSVRLQDGKTASSIRHHMPYIRNNLVMLFAAQTDESIGSQEGKDALRREALKEVRDLLLKEDHQEGVIDLYFTAFLIQK